jgi:protoheme IX farnesyltransferase
MITAYTQTRVATRARCADYLQLTRPRLCAMVLLTVGTGTILASLGRPDWRIVTHVLVGTALVAAGASALNQWLEREVDARMRRTRDRPLPAGRLQPCEVLVFGVACASGGVAYLAVTLAHPLAAAVALLTFLIYVGLYTPLKRHTPVNTLVGAIPGALPPVIGWTAVRGSVGVEAGILFGVLLLWQVPHFLAIAWIHRADYRRACLCMLPCVDSQGSTTGRQMIAYSLALLATSLMPAVVGGAGLVYLAGAVVLGVGFVACAVGFFKRRSVAQARLVLRASLIYLPGLLALWMLDGISRS